MDGWIDSISDDGRCSRETNKHGRERPTEGGVSPHFTESKRKASLMRWCHLSRHLKGGERFPGRGAGKYRGPEMGLCSEE